MKKHIVITALLFTVANMYCEETVSVPVVTENPVVTEAPKVEATTIIGSPAITTGDIATEKTDASTENNSAIGEKPVVAKKISMPTFADAKAWCSNHKLLLGGSAAVIGAVVLWKTCPAFRAFLGFEDEEEQEKFVY